MILIIKMLVESDYVLMIETVMDLELFSQLVHHSVFLNGGFEYFLDGIESPRGFVPALQDIPEFS